MRKLLAIMLGFLPTVLFGALNFLPSPADGEFVLMEGGYYVWQAKEVPSTGWDDPNTNSLVALYYFQTTNGSPTFVDSWTNSFDLTTMPSVATGPTAGVNVGDRPDSTPELVLSFDGVGDYAFSADNDKWSVTSFTFCAWVNTDTVVGNHAIFSKWATGNEYLFEQRTDAYYITLQSSGLFRMGTGAGSVNTGTWQNVVATHDAGSGETKIYLDGILKNTQTTTRSVVTGANVFEVGRVGAANYFNGLMDDVRVYNAAATSNWVYQLATQSLHPTNSIENRIGE